MTADRVCLSLYPSHRQFVVEAVDGDGGAGSDGRLLSQYAVDVDVVVSVGSCQMGLNSDLGETRSTELRDGERRGCGIFNCFSESSQSYVLIFCFSKSDFRPCAMINVPPLIFVIIYKTFRIYIEARLPPPDKA